MSTTIRVCFHSHLLTLSKTRRRFQMVPSAFSISLKNGWLCSAFPSTASDDYLFVGSSLCQCEGESRSEGIRG